MWGYKSPKWGYPNYNQLLTLRTRSHDDRCPEVSARAWLHTTVVDKFVRVLCLARKLQQRVETAKNHMQMEHRYHDSHP